MYTLHCKDCHHEWLSSEKKDKCDWCGGKSYPLTDEYYLLPKELTNKFFEQIGKINNE